jgi:hypothetical protein
MVACAYCEQPLICDGCQAEYVAHTQEQYEALSRREDAVTCPECEQVLVCHWCKTPYDVETEEDTETDAGE